jgi:metal-responsive CopG/Arc/MetJ family transcriptional regulator
MKTAVSIPDPIFASAEQLARKLHVSRSCLFANAVSEYVRMHATRNVTARLNEIYGDAPAVIDPAIRAMQATTLSREEW